MIKWHGEDKLLALSCISKRKFEIGYIMNQYIAVDYTEHAEMERLSPSADTDSQTISLLLTNPLHYECFPPAERKYKLPSSTKGTLSTA
jgi:hypothetical protein